MIRKAEEVAPIDRAAADRSLLIGLDVGSTTVKAVVVEPVSDRILWRDYQRHMTKQPEKVLEFLTRIESDLDLGPERFRLFVTGSGGAGIAKHLGAKFVQEVTAVSLAVEKLMPEANSVVELGGQDAKIIVFKEMQGSAQKKKIPSMNEKCAGGTGAVIDKINAKLQIPPAELCEQGYDGIRLHHVAGKCGVFAETDINGLQKQGVPREELMASLFESIVQQNLSVLTRGHTLRPVVLLLGGPNTYIRGMVEAWRQNIPAMWKERNVPVPDRPMEELIRVPENAQYFAALGAAEFGRREDPDAGTYDGCGRLRHYIEVGREEDKRTRGGTGLAASDEELAAFLERYRKKPWAPADFAAGEVVRGFVGIDGGSTSTKAVLMSPEKKLLAKAYQLSKGNPIEDTIEMFRELRGQVESGGATLVVLGVGTTGYAKDVLRDALCGDVALVETVAHTKSALHYYDDVDVICDVGGQDIKIIILNNGQVKDFKLNTQCSAGNGYFLQNTAEGFGHKVEEFADLAFSAKARPEFGYGCAVFMQSDIVDFQRQGWRPEEIMAGLASVLPKNIWLYVSQIPNLAKLGSNFVLQGGTQNNLAAVKAQVDFIESRFRGKDEKPNVFVHEHTGESGAIGAALEAARLHENGHETTFIGLEAVEGIEYTTTRSEETRCYFCKNKCLRTFIDVKTAHDPESEDPFPYKMGPEEPHAARIRHREAADEGNADAASIDASAEARRAMDEEKAGGPAQKGKSRLPLPPGTNRIIIATCEKGTVEDVDDMREIKKGLDAVKKANPNLVEIAAKGAFRSYAPPLAQEGEPKFALTPGARGRAGARRRRESVRIGMPRALNMYSLAPLFTAYFESLGVPGKNLVWSDYTTEDLYKEGAKRGAVDPCFPSKLGIPHVHNLLHVHHAKKPLDWIFFPMIDDLPGEFSGCRGHRACPTVTATPEAVKAAFTKEGDLFAEAGVRYLDTFVNPGEPELFERQMHTEFRDLLGLTPAENRRAVEAGYGALDRFVNEIRRGEARRILRQLEEEERLGIVLLGRPYHNDPGINHEILVEFQKLGYPIFTQMSLPMDDDILERLFGKDVEEGRIRDSRSVEDVWKNSYSENTTAKVFAAKYVARHPNLVALELSNFKCGHDAPIYTVIEEMIETSGTPCFSFKDIDENKPTGSIKIRVETIAYFLKTYREDMVRKNRKRVDVEERLRHLEAEFRAKAAGTPPRRDPAIARR
ncbi:MAG: BadF/BadG/BcrA/BcrD ATPase family protein [Candidatus Eisenbacteria bacterium]